MKMEENQIITLTLNIFKNMQSVYYYNNIYYDKYSNKRLYKFKKVKMRLLFFNCY